MKKISILLVALTLLSVNAGAQIKGENLDKALDMSKSYNPGTEELYWLDGSTGTKMYFYDFANTPVGLKHCIEKTVGILNANNLDFNNPAYNDELFASYVDNIFDYGSLDTSLGVGSSEVTKKWKTDDGWVIMLKLSKDSYNVVMANLN